MTNQELIRAARRSASAVYLAAEASVADDLSSKLRALATALEESDAERARLVEALTPSDATKEAFDGLFHFDVEDLEDDDLSLAVELPWEVTQRVMSAIRERAKAAGAMTVEAFQREAVKALRSRAAAHRQMAAYSVHAGECELAASIVEELSPKELSW